MASLVPKFKTNIFLCMAIMFLGTCFVSFWKNSENIQSLPTYESLISNQYDEELRNWLDTQERLKENIQKVCQKYGSSVRKSVELNQFMFDSEHNLLFCRNAKVGTTTWLTNFLLISSQHHHLYEQGFITDKQLHTEVPQLFRLPDLDEDKMKKFFGESISFSIVRHPFERLVSAFQDKFVDQEDNRNYVKFKEYMLAKFGEVTFTSFVHMIINRSLDICKEMKSCNFNKHWKPYISRCGYCDVSYKVIAKAENFAEDQKLIGHLANVTFMNIESHKSNGGDTKRLTKKYFSELDINTVKKLYEVYKVDFEMFGYSPDSYFYIA